MDQQTAAGQPRTMVTVEAQAAAKQPNEPPCLTAKTSTEKQNTNDSSGTNCCARTKRLC